SDSKDDPANAELLTIQPAPVGTLQTLRLGYEVDYDRTGTNPRPVAAHLHANAAKMLPKAPAEQAPRQLPLGSSGQCKGEPRVASVTINLTRPPQTSPHGPPPFSSETRPTRSLLSFDPVSLRTDDNGFMLSPLWYGNLGKHDTSGLEVVDDCKNFEYKHW